MRKLTLIRRFLVIGLLFISTAGTMLHSAIPESERAALIELYKATNGNLWLDNSGWKGNNNEPDGFSERGSEGSWYGVVVDGNHVMYLYLEFNELKGYIPAQLGNLSNLIELDLSGNYLSGSIPKRLGNLGNLSLMRLSYNQLTGSIPSEFGNLSSVKELDLSNNNISGTLPPQLGNLGNLSHLYLSNNQITGSIPAEFGNLSSLYWFDLFNNKISGSIPPELANLSNLNLLLLGSNELTGSIAPELGTLNLWYFDLSNNELTGSIPPELGNFSNCYTFDLARNHLTGCIPPELGNLTGAGYFLLESNQLTGDIPSTLTNLNNLTFNGLALDYNALYTTDEDLLYLLFIRNLNWEISQTIAPSNVSATTISDTTIRVAWDPILYTGDTGGYMVYYSAASGGPYKYSGITADKSAAFYDVTGLGPGRTYYLVVKTQTNPHSINNNTVVSEASEEVLATTTGSITEKDPPFGSFETPLDGSTAAGSIPVTGWALDDSGVAGVTIYREFNGGLFYVGDAVRVEGARPDVAASYPEYPENTKAGWGYMMLTNYLPNGGNGTFVLHAIAVDTAGKSTTLGTKTIICDNANAVKPFGALDTPIQGGSASGTSYKNWGWALTPQPNSIPTDGSTINVFVDGVNAGNPVYNLYREDIAALFPDYANSDGAVGYFDLDTTAYSDGVHTISWSVEDDAGNSDGIGSRYFSIQNTGSARGNSMCPPDQGAWLPGAGAKSDVLNIPVDDSSPVWIKRGYNLNADPEMVKPYGGIISITIAELERIELYVGHSGETAPNVVYAGYQMIGDQLKPLPIGSALDRQRGIFYWQPGPGFLGRYHFVFIEKGTDEIMRKKEVAVRITP